MSNVYCFIFDVGYIQKEQINDLNNLVLKLRFLEFTSLVRCFSICQIDVIKVVYKFMYHTRKVNDNLCCDTLILNRFLSLSPNQPARGTLFEVHIKVAIAKGVFTNALRSQSRRQLEAL